MEVILSAAVSLDGYLDDNTPQRLKLSSPEDWAQVQSLRAQCDAILVGAGTIRRDNPSLVITDNSLRSGRLAAGMRADIDKITLTSSGDIDPLSDFFTAGDGRKIVFSSLGADSDKLAKFDDHVQILIEDRITAGFVVGKLAEMGYKRLMVEGGGSILSMFLEEGVVDRFRLAVAPFFVGDESAPRLVCGDRLPFDKKNRLLLERVEMLGDMTVMHYKPKR